MGEGRGEGPKLPKNRPYSSALKKKARVLRNEMTPAEKIFWHAVKAKRFNAYKFRRQYPVGPYLVDFMCFKSKLFVEIDGGHHCESKRDEARTKFINAQGFEVLRFWNNEVLENIDGVLRALSLTLSHRERGGSQNPADKTTTSKGTIE